MHNGLVVSVLLITSSIFYYWNSRKSESVQVPTEAPQVQTSTAEVKPAGGVKEEVKPEKVLTIDSVKSTLTGYWVSKSSVKHRDGNRKIQMYFSEIKNPELHDGKVIEGLIFTFDEKNPSFQSLGKVVFDSIQGQSVKFKIDKKDVSQYYEGAGVYEEDQLSEIIITPGETVGVMAMNSYNEKAFDVVLNKLDAAGVLSKYKGKWSGYRKFDNQKIHLSFAALKDFSDDFGDFNLKGPCYTDSKFKIRPVDEKIVLISIGNASCQAGTMVYKSILDDSKLETIAYRQYDEAYEMKFTKD